MPVEDSIVIAGPKAVDQVAPITAGVVQFAAAESRPDVDVVVVTHNSQGTIAEALRSILDQTWRPKRLVVVDSASHDGTVSLVRSQFPEATLVELPTNVGYGKGNNLGAAICDSQLIAFVNPDVILSHTWIQEVASEVGRHPSCAAAEGTLLLSQQSWRYNCKGSFVNLLGYGCATGYGTEYTPSENPFEISYPSGAAFLIRSNVFQALGGFDENYFLYHEDVDLGLRTHALGWKILNVPRAVAFHAHHGPPDATRLRLLERNRWYTLVKDMDREYFLKTAPLHALAELGLSIMLVRNGMFRAKAQADLDLIKMFPALVRRRRLNDKVGLGFTGLAKKTLSGYYKAFFSRKSDRILKPKLEGSESLNQGLLSEGSEVMSTTIEVEERSGQRPEFP